MPLPSSVTRISDSPPDAVTTSTSPAPASSAFSTSSLTTLAGRSTTSPAAMRLIVSGDSWRMRMRPFSLRRQEASASADSLRRGERAGLQLPVY